MSEVPSHRRRPRYPGKNPRRFEDKHKELAGDLETVAKVLAGGKTPAGRHRPVLVEEVLAALRPEPGLRAVDATLGYGGHAEALLPRLLPDGALLGLEVDAAQLPVTEARLRERFPAGDLLTRRGNFAGLPKFLAEVGWPSADLALADLGVSSMQIDDPRRGLSFKHDGPLDMRLNQARGPTASEWLAQVSAEELAEILAENADEPRAEILAQALAGLRVATTADLVSRLRRLTPASVAETTIRRVFQALRIVVNDEFSALEALLRALPHCLSPGGRVAILTFHSGEDRRVKKSFAAGLASGFYSEISPEPVRPSAAEMSANPRSSSAKLRWATARR